jgi:ATP-dependent DNA ligase I
MDETTIATLRSILGKDVPTKRLYEILDASNGSVERAIDIYFHQEQDTSRDGLQPPNDDDVQVLETETAIVQSVDSSSNTVIDQTAENRVDKVPTRKRSPQKTSSSRSNGGQSDSSKQARLDSFFGVRKNGGAVLDPSGDAKISSDSISIASTTAGVVSAIDNKVEHSPKKNSKNGTQEATGLDIIRNHDAFTEPRLCDIPLALPSSKTIGIVDSEQSERRSPKQACSSGTTSFQRFSQTLQDMADTTKRLVKLSALETFIREVKDDGIESAGTNNNLRCVTRAQTLTAALDLILGGHTLAPLNVSGSAVSKALQSHLGVSRNQLSKAYRQYGDLGDCAASFFQKRTYFVIRSSSVRELSILDVSKGLRKISETGGRDAKQHILLSLLRGCTSKIEIRFLVRLLLRNMRIGANLRTCLAALAMAMMTNHHEKSTESDHDTNHTMDAKEAVALVQTTHDICPNLEKIVLSLFQGGFDQMTHDCSIQVLTPIAPMLAYPIHSLEEIRTAMEDEGNTSCSTSPNAMVMEWKYDGMRCQAHFDGKEVKLFSRHLLEITNQFPDVVKGLLEALRIENAEETTLGTICSFIVDAEIVGVQEGTDRTRLLPFQELSTRRKKQDDGLGVKVRLFAFDLMFLNGDSFIGKSLATRQGELRKIFKPTADFDFVASQTLLSYDEKSVQHFLEEAVANGAEGLMMKILGRDLKGIGEASSTYEAGARSRNWLKVKRDYVDGYADTIDVVPIGAWYGNGRKAQKSFLSPVLLAVYDDEEDVFLSISRCMTFTDAMYEAMREFYFNGVQYPKNLDSEDSFPANAAIGPIVGKQPEVSITDHGLDIDEGDGDSMSSDSQVAGENDDDAFPAEVDGTENDIERVNCFQNRPSAAFVMTNESPTIWFKPMEVFEVSFADLSLSRQHTAAAGLVDEDGRGVALRFPRFKRRRPDKKPEQATTSIEIAHLFAKQAKIAISGRS